MKGFTLLEILISMALTALILTAVYGAYASQMESIDTARENGRLQQTARIILDMMRKDLQCAFGEAVPGLEGEDREVEGVPADRLRVTTTASHATALDLLSGLYRVTYEMVRDERGAGFVLLRSQVAVVGEGVATEPESYVLTRAISGLDLQFQDSQGRMVESWNPREAGRTDRLPSLVRVRMVLKDPSGRERVFLSAAHPELAPGAP